jgi:hypothetical protein
MAFSPSPSISTLFQTPLRQCHGPGAASFPLTTIDAAHLYSHHCSVTTRRDHSHVHSDACKSRECPQINFLKGSTLCCGSPIRDFFCFFLRNTNRWFFLLFFLGTMIFLAQQRPPTSLLAIKLAPSFLTHTHHTALTPSSTNDAREDHHPNMMQGNTERNTTMANDPAPTPSLANNSS